MENNKQTKIELGENIDNAKFCNDCSFLNPSELEQTKEKEDHLCLLFKKSVKHLGNHPNIMRCIECIQSNSKTIKIRRN